MAIIQYSDYTLSFSVSGSAGGAAFTAPDDGSNLADSRTGSVQGLQWIGGTQNTGSYVEITVTISSVLDSTKRIGSVGLCNCSLPAGTKIVVQGITQRLVQDTRGERNAWFVPQTTTASTFTVRIYNDVNGVASIVANTEFSIGEITVGRVISLCTLNGANPNRSLQDPTAVQRSSGGQLWALMRKPYWQIACTLGRFTTAQAKGGADSDLPDGAGGVIDIQTLKMRLSTMRSFAVCDTPFEPGGGALHGVVGYDQDFMQTNWMLARLGSAGTLGMDQRPYWSWNPGFIEAT